MVGNQCISWLIKSNFKICPISMDLVMLIGGTDDQTNKVCCLVGQRCKQDQQQWNTLFIPVYSRAKEWVLLNCIPTAGHAAAAVHCCTQTTSSVQIRLLHRLEVCSSLQSNTGTTESKLLPLYWATAWLNCFLIYLFFIICSRQNRQSDAKAPKERKQTLCAEICSFSATHQTNEDLYRTGRTYH